ncbi:MAG: phosphonate C-P lyase system protein PhnG [Pseudomonadota bacterium]
MTLIEPGDRKTVTRNPPDHADRQAAMAIFSRATGAELVSGLKAADCTTDCRDLRPVETGLVMARGRISGTGQPFNLGEVTVTRAAIQLADGSSGFSYLRGRSQERARLAAIADAHWQNPEIRRAIEFHIVQPVKQRLDNERQKGKAEVAATQVDFFTMVRGDD